MPMSSTIPMSLAVIGPASQPPRRDEWLLTPASGLTGSGSGEGGGECGFGSGEPVEGKEFCDRAAVDSTKTWCTGYWVAKEFVDEVFESELDFIDCWVLNDADGEMVFALVDVVEGLGWGRSKGCVTISGLESSSTVKRGVSRI